MSAMLRCSVIFQRNDHTIFFKKIKLFDDKHLYIGNIGKHFLINSLYISVLIQIPTGSKK